MNRINLYSPKFYRTHTSEKPEQVPGVWYPDRAEAIKHARTLTDPDRATPEPGELVNVVVSGGLYYILEPMASRYVVTDYETWRRDQALAKLSADDRKVLNV